MKTKRIISGISYGATLLLVVIAAGVDILISEGRIVPLIVVGNDFVSSVFSGILTFSTLGLSVLSIIIGVLDTKNYGLRLRDILSFKASPVKFSRYIVVSTVLTLTSMVALIFRWCTLISVVAIVTILHTNITSIMVFRIITKKEFCKKIVLGELEKGNNNILSNHIINWVDEYKNAIIHNYETDIHTYAEILKKCTDHVKFSIVENSLRDLFEAACQKQTVGDAIALVFNPLDMQSHIVPICVNSIKRLRYASADEVARMDLPGAVESIILSIHLRENDKQELTYHFFDAIIGGNMLKEQKLNVFGRMLEKLTPITNDMFGITKGEVICWIFSRFLITEEQEINETLYEMLMKSLYLNNMSDFYKNNRVLMSTMARLVMGAYFYSELASRSRGSYYFNQAKCQRIRELVHRPIMLDLFGDVSLKTWIIPYREQFFDFYVDNTIGIGEECRLYNSYETNTKEKNYKYIETLFLWSRDQKAKFALWYYFAFCADYKCKLLRARLEKLRNALTYVSSIRGILLSQYEDNGTELTKECREQIKSLGCYYGNYWSSCTSAFVKNTYDLIYNLPHEHSYEVSLLVP